MKVPFDKDAANIHNVEVICPYCNKTGNKPIMKRWHFDNCKSNLDKVVKKMKTKEKPVITDLIVPTKVTKKTRETDMSHDPDYCDFIPGTYFWHCVMARRGIEPQASVSREIISRPSK